MTHSPFRFPTRRRLLAGGVVLAATPAFATLAKPRIVTILGDSITAGLGLPATDALPARLQAALGKLGVSATVRGAGVSGDTTAGGLARLDFSVQSDTDVCVVALGGNDLLQGLDPKASKRNLDAIVRRLKARRIGVVLAGLSAPPQIGKGYARDYDAMFPAVAQANAVALYPDLRKGVAGRRDLTQNDGLHPNARGVLVMAAGLAPTVAKALKSRRP
jgi:acyl-CoA thioesterase-1